MARSVKVELGEKQILVAVEIAISRIDGHAHLEFSCLLSLRSLRQTVLIPAPRRLRRNSRSAGRSATRVGARLVCAPAESGRASGVDGLRGCFCRRNWRRFQCRPYAGAQLRETEQASCCSLVLLRYLRSQRS